MSKIFFIIHILISVSIIFVILLQRGKGAEAGMVIGGSTSSKAVLGVGNSNSFLIKITVILSILFVLSTLNLNYLVFKHENLKIINNDYEMVKKNNITDINNNVELPKIPN